MSNRKKTTYQMLERRKNDGLLCDVSVQSDTLFFLSNKLVLTTWFYNLGQTKSAAWICLISQMFSSTYFFPPVI